MAASLEGSVGNYLLQLPDELKIKILSYLSSFDIFQLSHIPELTHLSFDKQAIREFSISKEYGFSLRLWNSFVLHKLRREIITSLNINCVYWLPAPDIRRGLHKMCMLEHFYAVDTKIGLSLEDAVAYLSLPFLKSLALTVSDNDSGSFPLGIINLYLHVNLTSMKSIANMGLQLRNMKKLKKLWVVDVSCEYELSCMRIVNSLSCTLSHLTVVFYKISDAAGLRYLPPQGTVAFKKFKDDICQVSYELFDRPVNDIYKKFSCQEASWDILINQLKYDYPFGVKDARKLILEDISAEHFSYEECNMTHPPDLCCTRFRVSAKAILTAPNMSSLKKLALNYCLCGTLKLETPIMMKYLKGGCIKLHAVCSTHDNKNAPLFKRQRVGVRSITTKKTPLEEIAERSPLIEELELWACNLSGYCYGLDVDSLSCIQSFTNLRKLTLHQIPSILSCHFLVTICKSCTHLTSLRIHSDKQKSVLMNNMCEALLHAHSLKDLRCSCSIIEIDRLMQTLSTVDSMKLDRLYIKCDIVDKFTEAPFKKFLDQNPQLKFVCIVITNMPKVVIRTISKELVSYKTSPEQVFIVTNDLGCFTGKHPLPYVHRREMVDCRSEVGVIDVFNGFTK